MADAMRIQKPFLSKVINGHSHLTRDQLFLACDYLHLAEDECEFIYLMHEYNTSSLHARQTKLLQKIHGIQRKYRQTEKHINTSEVAEIGQISIREYYLDPIFQLLHVGMSIERYRRDVRLFAADLLIPPERVFNAIRKLEELGILRREGAELRVSAHNLHLPRNSAEYMAWHSQLRAAGVQRCQNLHQDAAYGFSVVFSSDEKTRKKIQEKFLKFVSEVQKMSQGSEEKNLYQMNFDLFNWNQSPLE